MSARAEVSVVIVNWNSVAYLRACLRSLAADGSTRRRETIVVDSGSFDGCAAMLDAEFPTVRFVQSELNVGFARANNIGASMAEGAVLVFLNPDTEVRPGALDRLAQAVHALPHAGVVGPRLLNTDGTLQRSCVQPMPTILNQVIDADVFYRWFPRSRLWTGAQCFEGEAGPCAVEALSGACMAMRRDVFERAGGFSADYFMYAEDLDLCWKVRGLGLGNVYLPDVEVVHHGGGSSRQGRSLFSEVMVPESTSRLLAKTRGRLYSASYRAALSAAAVARVALLVASFPVGLAVRKAPLWRAVIRKWLAILRWGIGRETWVKGVGQPR